MKLALSFLFLFILCFAGGKLYGQSNTNTTVINGIIITSKPGDKNSLYEAPVSKPLSNVPKITTNKTEGIEENACGLKAAFTPSYDSAVESDFSVTFTCTTPSVRAIWLVNNIPWGSGETITISRTEVGLYEIKLVVSKDGCTDTAKCYYSIKGSPVFNSNVFHITYGIDGKQFMREEFDTAQNGFLISGLTYIDGYNNTPRGLIIKTNGYDCIEWSKLISTDDPSKEYYAPLITELKNSDFILMGGNTNTILSRLNSAGNLLWSNRYLDSTGDNFLLYVKKEAANGNIYIVGWPHGYGTNIILCLSPTGNVLWSRQFEQPVSRLLNLSIEDLVTDGNDIYMCGFIKKDFNHEQYIAFVSKLSATDGSIKWTKTFEEPKKSTFMLNIYMVNGSLLTHCATTDIYNGANPFSSVQYLDTANGAIKKSFKLIYPDVGIGYYNSKLILAKDSSYYVFNLFKVPTNIPQQYTNQNYFYHFDKQDNLLWARTYESAQEGFNWATVSQDNGLAILGDEYSPLLDPFNYYQDAKLSKIDYFGNAPCDIANTTGNTENYKLDENTIAFNVSNYKFKRVPQKINLRDANTTFRYHCPDALPQCNYLRLEGPSSICDLQQSYSYLIHREKNCFVKPKFEIKPSPQSVIQTDSSLTIKFDKPGDYKVKIYIDGHCIPVADSMFVNAASMLSKLSLGNDTSLCTGNSLLLSPGRFSSYLWQDGSDDSIFLVTQPGKYFVTVTDSCNNTLSDTIIITEKTGFEFSLLSKTYTICKGDSATLLAPGNLPHYSWQPSYNISDTNIATPVIYPLQDTQYILTVNSDNGCSGSDTAKVFVKMPAQIFLGNDTSICKSQPLTLAIDNGFNNIVWNTGEHTNNVEIINAGIYSVNATDSNSCMVSDSINIINAYNDPVLNLPDVAVICSGSSLILNPGDDFSAYQWQDESTASNYIANSTGSFYVIVTDSHGCRNSDTTLVTGIVSLPSGFLIADTTKCNYDTLLLQSNSVYNKYLWSTGATSHSIKIFDAGTYWLQVTDSNSCTAKEYVSVTDKECYNTIYFPTAFTPNNDGLNDYFRPKVYGRLQQFHLTIYNRWGTKIFETNDPVPGWDGKVNGVLQNNDSFVWVAVYQLIGSKAITQKGMITIVK